jgi:tyrosyl-tRNA synthetase
MDAIEELLTRGVANIIPGKQELEKALRSGKKLNIYFGIDPTGTRIHLGHAVPIRKLKAFAELGHHVTFLIGDFTALIGDTSDKESERPAMTQEQIEQNFQTYKRQAEKVLDFSKVKVVHNSDWLKKLSFEDIVKLTQHFSVGDFVGRELIKKRLGEGKRVGLHEFLYPVMQGYDSYMLDTDLQIGGTDQTFNIQAGRTLQKDLRGKETFALTTPILEGTDARKMSKTWDNAIWLEDNPQDMYGKVMSIKDDLIIPYFTLATSTPMEDVNKWQKALQKGDHPMSIKKILAQTIVTELHDEKAAKEAAENFERIVQNEEKPTNIPVLTFSFSEVNTMGTATALTQAGLTESNSEAKRLIEQGGVKINGNTIDLTQNEFKNFFEGTANVEVQVGKRKFAKIKIQK